MMTQFLDMAPQMLHRAVYLLLKYHMPVNTSKNNLIIVTAPAG